MTQPHELGAAQPDWAFLARELSPVEALAASAARVESTAGFNAFAALALAEAREAARTAEREYSAGSGKAGPLSSCRSR